MLRAYYFPFNKSNKRGNRHIWVRPENTDNRWTEARTFETIDAVSESVHVRYLIWQGYDVYAVDEKTRVARRLS